MTRWHYLVALLLVGLLALAGWRWYTTPVPPEIPLAGRDPAVIEAVQAALDEVRHAPRSGAAWGKLALVAAANGYAEPALVCLAQAEQLEAANPRWPYLQAHLLLAGHPHEAFPLLRQALERAENAEQLATIRFRLVLALLEDGQLDDAAEQLQALEALDTERVRVQFGRGLLAAELDDRPAARANLAAVEASPFAHKQAQARLAALALADGDKALARSYQQRLAALPADLPWPDPFVEELNACAAGRQTRFLEAEGLEATGRLPQAVALLRQIAADTPDGRSYLALGLGLAKLGAYGEAESVLRAVVRMDARNLQAHHHLGTVLLLEGEQQLQPGGSPARTLFQQAIDAEDQALAIQREHAMAHLTRGRALRQLGRTDEAIAAMREAVLGRPEFTDTHLYLGETLAAAGQRDEALVHLRDAVRFARPGDARPRQALEKWQSKGKEHKRQAAP